MNEPPVIRNTGLDGKSFLLGALAGALVVAAIAAVLFFARNPGVIRADRANAVAAAPLTVTSPDTPKIPVEGTWFHVKYPGRPCAITATPTGFIVTDQNGAVSRLDYDPAGVVIAIDWRGGLRGDVETNTIRWSHGAVWVRMPQEQ